MRQVPLRCSDDECPVYRAHGIDADLCQHVSSAEARLKNKPCPHTARALREEAQRYRRLADALDRSAEMREREEARP